MGHACPRHAFCGASLYCCDASTTTPSRTTTATPSRTTTATATQTATRTATQTATRTATQTATQTATATRTATTTSGNFVTEVVFRDADWDMFSDSDIQEALAFRGGIWEALTAGDHPVAAPTEIRAIEVRDHRDGVVVHVEARSYNGAARVERFFALENVCVTVGDADYCESGVVLHTTTGPDASTTVASTNGRSGGENPNSNPSSDDGSSLPSLSVIVPLCVMVAFFLVVIIAIVIRKKR